MKLGKTLDLSKCFYDKDHWTHPDLKEGQLYIAKLYDALVIGNFRFKGGLWVLIQTNSNGELDFGAEIPWEPNNITDIKCWKHIQEVLV